MSDLKKGVRLNNRYEICETVCISDLSIVYMGFDILNNRDCVVKEYYPKGKVLRDLDDKKVIYKKPSFMDIYYEEVDSFLNEAKILMKFNHKNIVQCFDFFKENDTGYIVLKYYKGKTLDKFIMDEKSFYISSHFKDILIPLFKAVDHIHGKGIIHRDIKPRNIIIGENCEPVIIDFGSACSYKKNCKRKIFYTQNFSPVEFYSDRTKIGRYSDIFSLSATLYFYLSGRPPKKVAERLIEDKIDDIRQYNKEISNFFAKRIMKNLSVDYKKRYSSLWIYILVLYFEYKYLKSKENSVKIIKE